METLSASIPSVCAIWSGGSPCPDTASCTSASIVCACALAASSKYELNSASCSRLPHKNELNSGRLIVCALTSPALSRINTVFTVLSSAPISAARSAALRAARTVLVFV